MSLETFDYDYEDTGTVRLEQESSVLQSSSAFTQVITHHSLPYRDFAIDLSGLDNDTVKDIESFFNRHKGPEKPFLFVDKSDYIAVEETAIRLTPTTFRLIKKYGTKNRPIRFPYDIEIVQAVPDDLGGFLPEEPPEGPQQQGQDPETIPAFTEEDGVLTFAEDIDGDVIVSFKFKVPVRFMDANLKFELEPNGYKSTSIDLREVPASYFDEPTQIQIATPGFVFGAGKTNHFPTFAARSAVTKTPAFGEFGNDGEPLSFNCEDGKYPYVKTAQITGLQWNYNDCKCMGTGNNDDSADFFVGLQDPPPAIIDLTQWSLAKSTPSGTFQQTIGLGNPKGNLVSLNFTGFPEYRISNCGDEDDFNWRVSDPRYDPGFMFIAAIDGVSGCTTKLYIAAKVTVRGQRGVIYKNQINSSYPNQGVGLFYEVNCPNGVIPSVIEVPSLFNSCGMKPNNSEPGWPSPEVGAVAYGGKLRVTLGYAELGDIP